MSEQKKAPINQEANVIPDMLKKLDPQKINFKIREIILDESGKVAKCIYLKKDLNGGLTLHYKIGDNNFLVHSDIYGLSICDEYNHTISDPNALETTIKIATFLEQK